MMKRPFVFPYVFGLFIAAAVFMALTLATGSCKSKKKIAKERADSAAYAQQVADEMSSDADRMLDSINRAMEMAGRIADSTEQTNAAVRERRWMDSVAIADSTAAVLDQWARDSTRLADSIAASKKKPKK